MTQGSHYSDQKFLGNSWIFEKKKEIPGGPQKLLENFNFGIKVLLKCLNIEFYWWWITVHVDVDIKKKKVRKLWRCSSTHIHTCSTIAHKLNIMVETRTSWVTRQLIYINICKLQYKYSKFWRSIIFWESHLKVLKDVFILNVLASCWLCLINIACYTTCM